MISITQMRYILSVSKLKNVSAAAKENNVSQPTLSMQLKKAEELMGFKIFDREKSPVVATLRGIRLIQKIKRIVKEVDELKPEFLLSDSLSGIFKLGVIPTVAPYLIPLFIRGFEKKYPNVFLEVIERQTSEILVGLERGEIDLGIMATPLDNSNFFENVLYYESFLLYFGKGHRLLKNKSVDLADLDNEILFQLEDGHCLRNQSLNICIKLKKLKLLNSNILGGQLETLMNMAKKFGGVTIIPEMVLEYMHDEEKKLTRPIKGRTLTREISIISRRFFEKEEIINAIESEVIQNLPKFIKSHKKSKIKVIPIN